MATLDQLAKRGLAMYQPKDVGAAYQAVYGNKWVPSGRSQRGAAAEIPVLANQALDVPGATVPVSQLMYLYGLGQRSQNLPTAVPMAQPQGSYLGVNPAITTGMAPSYLAQQKQI